MASKSCFSLLTRAGRLKRVSAPPGGRTPPLALPDLPSPVTSVFPHRDLLLLLAWTRLQSDSAQTRRPGETRPVCADAAAGERRPAVSPPADINGGALRLLGEVNTAAQLCARLPERPPRSDPRTVCGGRRSCGPSRRERLPSSLAGPLFRPVTIGLVRTDEGQVAPSTANGRPLAHFLDENHISLQEVRRFTRKWFQE